MDKNHCGDCKFWKSDLRVLKKHTNPVDYGKCHNPVVSVYFATGQYRRDFGCIYWEAL
jgi:hypothetical protein